jgi:hypothetical protein
MKKRNAARTSEFGRRHTSIDSPVSRPRTALRTVWFDDTLFGVREAGSPISNLAVRAGPFHEKERIMKSGDPIEGYTAYILSNKLHQFYIGSGNVERRMGDLLTVAERESINQLFVVHLLNGRDEETPMKTLEQTLYVDAVANGVQLFNKTPPASCNRFDIDSPDSEQLAHEVYKLLAVVTCTLRLPHHVSRHSKICWSGKVIADGIRVFEPGRYQVPDTAIPMELTSGTLTARGYMVDDERFYIVPGSGYCLKETSGLSETNKWRREEIEKEPIFEHLPGAMGYGRLKMGLECDTIDIAAKIVTGMHNLGAIGWVPASPAAVNDMAGTNQCRTSGNVVDILPTFNVAAGMGRTK